MAHHAAAVFSPEGLWGAQAFDGLFGFGFGRIEFFFVASGFVIALWHLDDIGQPAKLAAFAWRRVIALYPLYLVVLGGLLAIMAVQSLVMPIDMPSPARLLASAALIGPDSRATVIFVAWTLYHEVLFYIAFGIAILDRRIGAGVAGLAALAGLAGLAGLSVPGLPEYVVSPINLLFLFGIGVAVMVRREARDWSRASLAAGVPIAALLLWQANAWPGLAADARSLIAGLGWAAGIAALVAFEARWRLPIPGMLLRLGEASFALYLIHFFALMIVSKLLVMAGVHRVAGPEIGILLVSGCVIAVAVVLHRVVERPMLARLRAFADRRPDRQRARGYGDATGVTTSAKTIAS